MGHVSSIQVAARGILFHSAYRENNHAGMSLLHSRNPDVHDCSCAKFRANSTIRPARLDLRGTVTAFADVYDKRVAVAGTSPVFRLVLWRKEVYTVKKQALEAINLFNGQCHRLVTKTPVKTRQAKPDHVWGAVQRTNCRSSAHEKVGESGMRW